MAVIALDALGGDYGLPPNLDAALAFAASFPDSRVLLVGPQAELAAALAGRGDGRITVVDAPEVIGMDESPVTALRQKRKSSIAIGLRCVRNGEADGFVSAGNTGAVMAAAKTILGLIPGINRPVIASHMPKLPGGVAVLADAGANVDCKPKHLAQFALMAVVYMEQVLGTREPRVGLLSVGTEAAKGNEQTKAAYALLDKMPLRFAGNVEGNNIIDGSTDVIVCDGFVGNVALKFGESVALGIFGTIRAAVSTSWRAKLGALLLKPVFMGLRRRMDYAEYGGAPLLGVKGGCLICHGKSDARAMTSALRAAREFAAHAVPARIEQQMAESIARGIFVENAEEVTA